MGTHTVSENYRCDNDCKQEGCPFHEATLSYNSVSDIFVFDDGFVKHYFDVSKLRTLLSLLSKSSGAHWFSSIKKAKESTRFVAISGGGDWTDASCNHYVIPEGMNLGAEKYAYDKWYREYNLSGQKGDYISFEEYLKEHGMREANNDEVLEFRND